MSTDQDEWEDYSRNATTPVVEEYVASTSLTESGSPRKKGKRKVFPASKHTRFKANTYVKPSQTSSTSRMHWSDVVSSASLFTLNYVFEVLRFALIVLRKPLSLILVGYLLAIMVSHLRTTIGTALHPTITTLCQLPGISRLSLCRVTNLPELARTSVQRADYPSLVDIQSTTFEQLLDDSAGGAGLALDIKKAEMATADLMTLVKISHLTNKERLADTLGTFVDDAKQTGRGLQRFSAKVGGVVDRIIAMNDYALKHIEEAASQNSHPSLWKAVLSPFSLQTSYAIALTASFHQAMSMLESDLHMLILAAEASLHDLEVLEEQLKLIHSMASLEDEALNASKSELLAQLWTILGGNRAELRRFDTTLSLLDGLAEYRKQALAHVIGALHTLQAMSADLENLRERVSQPVLTGEEPIPLEVHVKSIRTGLDRLTEGRLKAKKVEKARYAKLADALGT